MHYVFECALRPTADESFRSIAHSRYARNTHLQISTRCLQLRARACVWHTEREAFDPDRSRLTMLFESAATKTPRCRTQHLAFDNGGSLAMIERRMQMMYDVRCILVTVILVSSWLEPRHSHRWEKRTREGKISRAEKGLSKPRFRRNKIIIATPRVTRGKREGRVGEGRGGEGGGKDNGIIPSKISILENIFKDGTREVANIVYALLVQG